jgi:predicted transcriptional regulator
MQHLSEITAALTQDQLEAWTDSCKTSGVVLDNLASTLMKRIDHERKHLRLDELLKASNPMNELLARQAKIEAYEEIINLVIDK